MKLELRIGKGTCKGTFHEDFDLTNYKEVAESFTKTLAEEMIKEAMLSHIAKSRGLDSLKDLEQ